MTAPPEHVLFTGPFEALEAEFLRRLARLQEDDPLRPVEVLVGSNLLGVYLRRQAAATRPIASVRFLTFVDLARLFGPPGTEPRLPALGAGLLARQALAATEAATVFGPLRGRPSLANALVRTAEDLRGARLDATALRSPSLGTSPGRIEFLEAVASSLEEYARLRSGFSDATSLIERAVEAGPVPSAEPLLVYGLSELDGLKTSLLTQLARVRPVVAFVPDDGAEGGSSGADVPVRGRLFHGILGVAPKVLAPEGSGPETRAVLAPTETAEAREVVRELLDGVASGIPLHRMAVLLRDPARQEPPLLAELRLRELPFYRPPGPGTASLPEGQALRLLFRLAAEEMPRRPLEELVSILSGLGTLPPVDPARVQAGLQLLGFAKGRETLKKRLAEVLARHEERGPTAEDPDGKAVGRRARERRAVNALRSAFEFVTGALPDVSPASWEGWATRLAGAADTVLGSGDRRRIADAAIDAVRSLQEVDPGARSAADFLALLPDALDAEPVRHGKFERSGVSILSAVSARGLRFDLVAVPGLVDQTFPKRGLPDPLLFDAERVKIREESRAPLATRSGERHDREERFLYDVTARSARRRLVLLAAERDAGTDRPRVLSTYLLEHLSPPGRVLTEQEIRDETKAPASVRRLKLGHVEMRGPALDEADALLRAISARPRRALRLDLARPVEAARKRKRARFSGRFTEFEGKLGRPVPLPVATGKAISASRLERSAACAYRTFFADVLGLQARDEQGILLPVLDGASRGNLVHDVLRAIARDLVDSGCSFAGLSEDEGGELARVLSARAAAEWAAERWEEAAPLFVEVAARDVEELVAEVLRHERERPDPLPPAGAEIRFGRFSADGAEKDDPLSSDGPARVEAGGIEWTLVGKIDRLDRDGDRLRVVDYKATRPRPYGKRHPDAVVAAGERLQLPVYALAARRLGGEEVSSEYLFVRRENGKVSATPASFTAEQTDGAIALLRRFLEILALRHAAGDLTPRVASAADGNDPCAHCDFDPICAPGHARLFGRKLESESDESPARAAEELP